MRLKKIKLAGFKSFVDATTVTLPGNRCAVVGPNGCGKSNIIDAVRWVMGESSAKQLRGENITDVIFNGSNTRKPNSAASIELSFDNSDGRIGGEYSAYADIAIRRQVTRDGQSNYFLNGNRCRRRDIQDIFLGTGFGPRSYSIIEQGMISQLVEAKPDELRVYLEEAAGISKYKERRRETSRRIADTRDNLARINDIRDELSRQLDRLKRQAQAAERYRELKTEESLTTAQLYVLRYNALEKDRIAHDERIQKAERELEQTLVNQKTLEAQIEAQRLSYTQLSEQVNQIQGEFYSLGADIGTIEETLRLNESRAKQLLEERRSVEAKRTENLQQIEQDERAIRTMQSEIEGLAPSLTIAADADATARTALERAEHAGREWQTEWNQFLSNSAASEKRTEVQRSRIEYLRQSSEQLSSRLAEIRQAIEQPKQDYAPIVEQLALEISGMEDTGRNVDAQLAQCLQQLRAGKEQIAAQEQVLAEARAKEQRLRQDLASLQAVQDAALGQGGQEAEAWIAQNDLHDAPRVGEHLAVVPGWESAIEAVLEDFLQALEVDSIDALSASLADLIEGRLTLVQHAAHSTTAYGEDTVGLPPLSSLIRSEALLDSSLMHGVYAAESIDVAMRLRTRLQKGQSIITREGFWLGLDWVRVCQNDDASSGIIERGQQLETLNLELEQAVAQSESLQTQLNQQREASAELEGQREVLQEEVNRLTQDLGSRRTDHSVSQVKMQEADARRSELQIEADRIQHQLADQAEQADAATQILADSEKQQAAQQSARGVLDAAKEQIERQLYAAREAANQSREQFHEIRLKHEALQGELRVSLTAKDRLQAQKNELAERLVGIEQGIRESSGPMGPLRNELSDKLAARITVEDRLVSTRGELQGVEVAIEGLEAERAKVEVASNGYRSQLEGERVQRQGLTVNQHNLIDQIAATGHDRSDVTQAMPEDAEEAAWSESLERIARRIQRLGAINLAAIEEFDQESERKNYLDGQAQDLEEALTTLESAMQKIDKETKVRFKDTFEAVNAKLGELFPKVFGGGRAHLELVDEDLLDTGVTLMAQPPGKRNASVQLLSGGEKAMTAVALIFAIFHLNPSPVCLLDEVDAPLDDMNVTRFAALIKEMSESVQFLVITHNKITMEMADYLMGVTMHEPGVSRLVSVDVESAIALALAVA